MPAPDPSLTTSTRLHVAQEGPLVAPADPLADPVFNGAYLKRLRASHKLTTREVAEGIGKRLEEITKWENGKTPLAPTVLRMARYFGVPMENFYETDTLYAVVVDNRRLVRVEDVGSCPVLQTERLTPAEVAARS